MSTMKDTKLITWTMEENRQYNIILLRLANSQYLLKASKDTTDAQ